MSILQLQNNLKSLQQEILKRTYQIEELEQQISTLEIEKQEILEVLKLVLPKDSIPIQHIKLGQEILFKYLGYLRPMDNQLTDEDITRLRPQGNSLSNEELAALRGWQ